MKLTLIDIYNLCQSMKIEDVDQHLRSKITGNPSTVEIKGDIEIEVKLKN
jgi:hypothetical protein